MAEHQSSSPFALHWYLTSSSLWLVGMSLQGFLITWMLVGILDVPPGQYSLSRALIEIPPMAVLFLGGLWADRTDGRRVLMLVTIAVTLPPLALAPMAENLSFWPVVAFAMAMAVAQSMSDPARQAMINHVTRTDIQRTVTLVTIVTTFVGLGGVWLGGHLDKIGLTTVLLIESAVFAISLGAVYRLPKLPVTRTSAPNLTEGFKRLWALPLVRNVIGLNFLSSLFNAGAYIVGMPYIVTEVYEGDAQFFAQVMIFFTIGSVGSNIILFFIMPLLYPGRVFLVMQLTRIAILCLLWFEPPVWLFLGTILLWGLNMGVTSTLVRTTVQELAPPSHRAQILAFLLFSFMVSSPISAVLLGALIEVTDPMSALLPGIPISLAIFLIGISASGLWAFRSPSAPDAARGTA